MCDKNLDFLLLQRNRKLKNFIKINKLSPHSLNLTLKSDIINCRQMIQKLCKCMSWKFISWNLMSQNKSFNRESEIELQKPENELVTDPCSWILSLFLVLQPYTSQNYHVLLLCPHYTEISHHASVWCNFRFDSFFSASRKKNDGNACSWSETIDEPHHMLIRFACKCIIFKHTQRRTCQHALSSSPISTLKNHSSSFSLENLQPQKNLLKSLFICC